MAETTRIKVDEKEIDGVVFRVWRYHRKQAVVQHLPVFVAEGEPARVETYVQEVDIHQVSAELKGGSIVVEPGALQYCHGDLDYEVLKHEPGKGWFSRHIAAAGTGESPYGVRYSGTGTVWMEPSRKHFIIVDVEDGQPLLLDDRAFYACTGKVRMETYRHNTVSGVLSGNGLVQPKLTGTGVAIVESPVSENELDFIQIEKGQELVVDGDYMLFYGANMDVRLTTLVPGLLSAHRTGEGLVFKMKGPGHACIMPTARIA